MLVFALGAFPSIIHARVVISVDAGKVKAEIPRTLYGTGLEDVNHEIYGGLDAQRLYDESFEETEPAQLIAVDPTVNGSSGKACGRQWTALTGGGGLEFQDAAQKHLGRRAQVLMPNGGFAGVWNAGLNGWGSPAARAGKCSGVSSSAAECRGSRSRCSAWTGSAHTRRPNCAIRTPTAGNASTSSWFRA